MLPADLRILDSFNDDFIVTRPTLSQLLEPQDQGIGEFHVVHKRRAVDFEAHKR